MLSLILSLWLFCSAHAAGPLVSTVPVPKEGLSLSEAYQAALKRSETFGIQEQLLVQATELESQAKAALLPNIAANATFLRQDTPTATTLKQQNTVRLTGTQPLFRGFREFALIRQRDALTAQQSAALQDAARLLFYDVTDAFYATLALQADSVNFGNELELGRRRLKELEGFRRVGRSRASEVLSQRANIANLEAQLEATRGQLKVQRDVLAFLTGLPAETPLKDVEAMPTNASVGKVDSFLAGLGQRADILSSGSAMLAAEASVSATRGLHWPTADVVGNYYLERPGASKDIKWDVALVLSLPIFQGGAIQSQVRQSLALQEQATLQESRARRLAEQEVKRFHERVLSGQLQLEKLGEYADLSKQNHDAQMRDYSNGLVTNLDVLQATTSWHVAIRSRERQQLTLKGDYVKLKAAAGVELK